MSRSPSPGTRLPPPSSSAKTPFGDKDPNPPSFSSPFGRFDPEEASRTHDDAQSAAEKPRSISFAGISSDAAASSRPPPGLRRVSIQFAPTPAVTKPPANTVQLMDQVGETEEPKLEEEEAPIKQKQSGERKGSRLASPPPPSTYKTRVSFDTFNNPSVADPTFTLVSKHAGYTYDRHQRVFLVAMDQHDYSEFALKWLVEEMAEDGDEIICLRVVEREGKQADDSVWNLQRNYKQDAKQMLEHIQATNGGADNKAISIILEFAIGDVEETIQRMISIYSPAFLTVGTRGRSLGGIQGLLPGSVSKWCMQNSPVPVVMVRHPEKRRKKMQKRMNDPKRRGYSAILDQSASTSRGSPLARHNIIETSDIEAEAVAKAIGLSSKLENPKASRKEGSEAGSVKSDAEEGDESEPDPSSPTGVAFVEDSGIEIMPNYVGEPDDEADSAEPVVQPEKDTTTSEQKESEGSGPSTA